MKSKLTVYTLIVVVAVIWVIIFKQIFFSSNKNRTQRVYATEAASKKSYHQDSLLLNYPDPFVKPKNSTPLKRNVVAEVRPREKVSIILKAKINVEKQRVYVIDINGVQHTLKLGDEINGFLFKYSYQDSLVFVNNGHRYSVKTEY